MSSEIVNASGNSTALAELGMLDELMSGIAESRASTPIVGGKPFLRLLKSGKWFYGPSDEPVQEGSEWAVNPTSIFHGWCCWSNNPGTAKNELLGEVMVSIRQKKPERPEPKNGFEWAEQRAFDLRCVSGEDEGTEVAYKVASLGGMRACDTFFGQLQTHYKAEKARIAAGEKGPVYPVAIIQLMSDFYDHPKYGQTFYPIFKLTDWCDMDGNPMPNHTPDPAVTTTVSVETQAAETPPAETKPSLVRAGAVPKRQRPALRT